MEHCAVRGCDAEGKHKLGVRCRVWHGPSPVAGKGRTSALWAPDADAFLCDDHALGGVDMTLLLEPNGSEATSIRVIAGGDATGSRVTPIRR
jgi:hypothetical protein